VGPHPARRPSPPGREGLQGAFQADLRNQNAPLLS